MAPSAPLQITVAAAAGAAAVASAPPLDEVRDNMAAPIGDARRDFVVDNECVVCFDATVDSVLRPCGHVAMVKCRSFLDVLLSVSLTLQASLLQCIRCAKRVGTTCPICRAGIEKVE